VPSSSSFKGHSECHDVYSTLPPALELVSTSSDWTPVPRTTRTKPSVAKPAKSPTPHQSGGRQTTQAQAHSSSTSSGRMGSHVVNSHDQKKPKKSKKGKGKGGCIIM
jgi:BRCT domain type II-containing protein